MSTANYTFSGLTNPSSTHVATTGTTTDNTVASPGTEVATAGYTSLGANDADWLDTVAAYPSTGRILFKWKTSINPAYISQIDTTFIGWKTTPGSGMTFKIWNFTSGAFEDLDTDAGSADVTMTGIIASDFADYISGGYLYICVENSDGTLHSNFTDVTLTYTIPPINSEFFKLF